MDKIIQKDHLTYGPDAMITQFRQLRRIGSMILSTILQYRDTITKCFNQDIFVGWVHEQ